MVLTDIRSINSKRSFVSSMKFPPLLLSVLRWFIGESPRHPDTPPEVPSCRFWCRHASRKPSPNLHAMLVALRDPASQRRVSPAHTPCGSIRPLLPRRMDMTMTDNTYEPT